MKNRGCSPDDDSISEWSLAEEPGSPAYTVLLLLEVVEPFNKALVCLQAEEIQKIWHWIYWRIYGQVILKLCSKKFETVLSWL